MSYNECYWNLKKYLKIVTQHYHDSCHVLLGRHKSTRGTQQPKNEFTATAVQPLAPNLLQSFAAPYPENNSVGSVPAVEIKVFNTFAKDKCRILGGHNS